MLASQAPLEYQIVKDGRKKTGETNDPNQDQLQSRSTGLVKGSHLM